MGRYRVKVVLIWFLLTASASFAQKYPEGIWQGYDGEWKHVSQQLVALAEATPADKFAWRPAPGVRSTSQVYMHIVEANFYLLSITGPRMPADLPEDSDKKITSKAEVIAWLKRSLEAVKKLIWPRHQRTYSARCTSPIGTRRSTGCTCASWFTPTSTWDNSLHMPG